MARNKSNTPTELPLQIVYCDVCSADVMGEGHTTEQALKDHADRLHPNLVLVEVTVPTEPELVMLDDKLAEKMTDPVFAKAYAEILPCPHCEKVYKSKRYYDLHIEKHEAEFAAAEAEAQAEAEAAAADPMFMALGELKELLREAGNMATRSAADAHLQAEQEAALFTEIDELNDLINSVNDESIPALMSVPEQYRDNATIDKLNELVAKSVSRLAILKADPRFIRGRKVVNVVKMQKANEQAQAEANEFNQQAIAGVNARASVWMSLHTGRFEDLFYGHTWGPTKHKSIPAGKMPFFQDLWWKAHYFAGKVTEDKEAIPGNERTWEVMEPIVSLAFDAMMERYCFETKPKTFHKVVRLQKVVDGKCVTGDIQEVIAEVSLPIEDWRVRCLEIAHKIHGMTFHKGKVELAEVLADLGVYGSGKEVVSGEFLNFVNFQSDEDKLAKMTTLEFAFHKADGDVLSKETKSKSRNGGKKGKRH